MGLPPAARPVFRLAGGVAVASAMAFGLALPMGYLFVLLSAFLLAPPMAPPGPKPALILLAVVLVVTVWGVLLGPVLIYAPAAGVLLMLSGIAAGVWVGFRPGMAVIGSVLILSNTIIAVIAAYSSAAAIVTVQLCIAAIATALAVAHLMHAILPNAVAPKPPPPPVVDPAHARWVALRTAVIMAGPIILALSNPGTYILLLMKGSTLAAQVEEVETRRLGVETVGSTLMGAGAALMIWWSLKLMPGLVLLVLLLSLATLLIARPMYGAVRSRYGFTFWLNVLVTMIILIGPAVGDSGASDDIQRKMLMRTAMFTALSLYAVGAVRILDTIQGRRITGVTPTA